MDEYVRVNRAMWDERADAHAPSPGYDLERYVADPTALSDVVQFDVPRLGDIAGLDGVHLQCHIGTDTLSLARLGARMTGLDFSPNAIAQARRLAERAGADIRFVQAELYDAVGALGEQYDLVFTGIGALCWLPDVARWARVVAALLRPGGRLFIREGHPVLWSLTDGRPDKALAIEYPYFEMAEPMVFDEPGTYVETDHEFEATISHEWNHGLGQIVQAVIDAGLQLRSLEEHDSAPYDPIPGYFQPIGGGEWRLVDRPWRLPHTYTLQAVKPA
ncbi:MAG TPA: class I SAM-dependent methyltransferase [Acidimicrobiales bacterium]